MLKDKIKKKLISKNDPKQKKKFFKNEGQILYKNKMR
jgi:hypothetical protein